MTNAHAAPATPVDIAALALLGATAEVKLQAAVKRFQSCVQDWLDSPLDAERVLEWAKLRAAAEA
ncbi:MAG: hypothetical protein ABR613_03330 [Actinomycetota bacterium]